MERRNREVRRERIVSNTESANQTPLEKAVKTEKMKLNGERGSIITSKMLLDLITDENFFVPYNADASVIVEKIQVELSKSENSTVISTANAEPDNKKANDRAKGVIFHEYSKLSSSDAAARQILQKYTDYKEDILFSIILNELLGIGPLTPLFNDKKITEIIANGPEDVQVEIKGKIIKVPCCKFRNRQHLSDLIANIYGSVNKSISRNKPFEKARLHDFSRVHATHEMISPAGPNLNIRRHNDIFWTPADMVNMGALDQATMTELGNFIHNGLSFLVIGGTGTGKTSQLNSLTSFFRDDHRIITIEENLEMKPHKRKLIAAPMETVQAQSDSSFKGVTIRDLVKASLQMRPDGIVIGEISDGAAFDLCQALNTGHWGASTIHANTPEEAMERLKALVSQADLIKGDAVLTMIASAIDIVVHVERLDDGSRKIVEICEVAQYPSERDGIVYLDVVTLFKFKPDPIDHSVSPLKITGKWEKHNELSEYRSKRSRLDLVKKMSWEELCEIAKL